jgi:excisionase family DNA binding protein
MNTSTSQANEFYTVSETARHLRLCEKQVRRLIWRGELPAFRFGTALRIHKADIAAYIAARRITPVIQQGNKGVDRQVQTTSQTVRKIPQLTDSLSKY